VNCSSFLFSCLRAVGFIKSKQAGADNNSRRLNNSFFVVVVVVGVVVVWTLLTRWVDYYCVVCCGLHRPTDEA